MKKIIPSLILSFIIILLIPESFGQDYPSVAKPGSLILNYNQPANQWMTEALPIGNGPMGAMLFGGTETERIQFNEISLWSGDRMPSKEDIEEERMGAHQAFGDIFIRLGHDFSKVKNYKRQLNLENAIHRVDYDYEDVHDTQTAFASHADHVIVIHLTADKPGSVSGRVWLTDMHDAKISVENNRIFSVGKIGKLNDYVY